MRVMATRTTLFLTGKQQLELREEPIPQPQAGELLVQSTRTIISTGTEGILYNRRFDPGTHWDTWCQYPFRIGYMNAGRVIGIGQGVTGWQIGDRVVSMLGHTSHGIVGAGALRIPDNVSDDEAPLAVLGRTTQVAVRRAEHRLGDSVVIIGLGLLGQLVTQYVRLMGAQRIIAIDTAPTRLEMALRHGATHALNMPSAEALEPVRRITDGRLADVVYDVTGSADVFATALPLARWYGTVVLLGDTGTPAQQRLTGDVVRRGLKIVGAHVAHASAQPTGNEQDPPVLALSPWHGRRMDELFLDYLSRGLMRFGDMITHRYKPQQAPEAYEMLNTQRDKAMVVVFEWK